MAERAHPNLRGFKDKFFGLLKSKYRENLHKRYSFCNRFIKNKIILDIPCGMGWGTSILRGYEYCLGIDINEDAICEAKKRYEKENLFFKKGDMINIEESGNSFDVVICLEGFEHITFLEGQQFLKEVGKVLKRGGKLILSTPLLIKNKYHSGNRYHLCEYKESELLKVLSDNKFKILEKNYLDTSEGSKLLIVVCENGKS